MNAIFYDVKIKTNGHTVMNKPISSEKIIPEVTYYLQKYKLPINININRYSQEQMVLNEEEHIDLEVLAEQILLFESDVQIEQYIETEKLLATDVEAKLTRLCKAIIKISQKGTGKIDFNMKEFEKFEEKMFAKEKLNQIEEKCMRNLALIQEERKKLDLCVICWINPISRIIMPCMHFVLCSKCPVNRVCPVCKSEVLRHSIVYR